MVLEGVHKWITLSTGCGARWAVDNCGKSQSGYRMVSQLKRPGWCANTSSSGPDPTEEGYVDSTGKPRYVTSSGGNRRRTEKITRSIREAVRRRDAETCQECGYDELPHRLEIDHIIPYRLGGPTSLDNLRLLCVPCHRAKTLTERGA